ncbi:MAG: colicin M resistance protein CbrA, partial [Clostridia bacterium]|nr:colicin M resistance protein CbrA [Clostridia bacterium]
GISWGIASAKALAGVINSGTKNISKAYFIKTIKLRIKLCLKLIKSPFMYVPYLRRLVLKSGISSIKVKNKTSG